MSVEDHMREMAHSILNLEAFMEEATAHFKGTNVRVTVVEQAMANDTANVSADRKKRLNITTYKGFIDVPVFSGTHDEYEDFEDVLEVVRTAIEICGKS